MSNAPMNSRSPNDLRDDVCINIKLGEEILRGRGFFPDTSSTLRNDAYQMTLYAKGRTEPGKIVTNSKVTTFHGVGLAADFFQNVTDKEKQYNDPMFWLNLHEVYAAMGFSRLSSELCHIQWSDRGRYSGTRVRDKDMPPMMYDMRKAKKIADECGFSAPLAWMSFAAGVASPDGVIMQAYFAKVGQRLTGTYDEIHGYDLVDEVLNLTADDYWNNIISGKYAVNVVWLRALLDKTYDALTP